MTIGLQSWLDEKPVAGHQDCRAQERRMDQIGMIIGKGLELDHWAMVPRDGRGFQQ